MNGMIHLIVAIATYSAVSAFTAPNPAFRSTQATFCHETQGITQSKLHYRNTQLHSFVADSSDYKSSDSDFTSDEDALSEFGVPVNLQSDDDSAPIDILPVPMSPNAGNRFIAVVLDKALQSNDEKDVMDLHEERINLSEDHVMFCRKANLYNETFNTESKADVLWSHQLLSSDVQRTIGHVMCIESTTVEYAKDLLSRDPIIQHLTDGDISDIPFYRWRNIRDHTMRQDDGRGGMPYLLLAVDRDAEEGVGDIRELATNDQLEYMIRSERIVASGPLHQLTEFKDDPSSIAMGDFMIFNAKDRDEAIDFVENSPFAQAGLYGTMKLHRYNKLDVTGKFVAQNMVYEDKNRATKDLKDAMEYWGYPVDDMQTKWINW